MFVCRSCARRASAALSHRLPPSEARVLGTMAAIRRGHAAATAGFAALEEAAAQEREAGDGRAAAAEGAKSEKQLAWVVRKHLEHLKDPFKIAEHVQRTLQKDRFDEALALTREASKGAQCVVSWNHLIDHQMQQQKLHAAIKLYNEMKKRAQLPNAQTYTILFRGCAESAHPKLAVSEAVRIYHNMMKSPRLQPNTIHLNAVLRVCARANDLESMFALVETVDNHLRAPNNLTYTTILNALRYQWSKPRQPGAVGDEELRQNRAVAIQRAKAIWEEVVRRWRKGQIVIDEELMCAMGRVLLMGEKKDGDDVLALAAQVMNIPRPDAGEPAPGEPAANQLQRAMPGSYAAPGRNALSLVMQALQKTGQTTLAPRYWELFTVSHGVVPDSENWFSYLLVLDRGKASGKAAEVMASIPRQYLSAKTFQLAFKICVRDNLNENAFDNANAIFDVMASTLKKPDAASLRLYLQAATGNHRKFRIMEDKGDAEEARFALGRQIVEATNRLWEPLRAVSKLFSFPEVGARSPEEEWQLLYNDRMEAVALARRVVAATDKVVTEGMASPKVVDVLKVRRNVLNRYVVRFWAKHEQMEARLGRTKAASKTPRPSRGDSGGRL